MLYDKSIELMSFYVDEHKDRYFTSSDHNVICGVFKINLERKVVHEPGRFWKCNISQGEADLYNIFLTERIANLPLLVPSPYNSLVEIVQEGVSQFFEHHLDKRNVNKSKEPKQLRATRRRIRILRKKWEFAGLMEKWQLLNQLYIERMRKRELFSRFEAMQAEKNWTKWLNSPGGILKNLGSFIQKIKRVPKEKIMLRMKTGVFAVLDLEIVSELKRAWDLVYLHRFWDNWDPTNLPIYFPDNYFLPPESNAELSAEIQVLEIDLAIKKLKSNTSAGVTKIVPEALKCLNSEVRANLWYMFHNWFEKKEVPLVAKHSSDICLLHKGGRKDDVENYRTLSVQCNIGKLYPSMLYTRLCKAVEESKLLGEYQNGFRPARRAVDNLLILKTIHELAYHKLNKNKVYSAYIDLTKAYDRVNLQFLWYKLEYFGFDNNLIQALQSLYVDCNIME